ncbi:MAG: hypothetical protein V3U46_04280 [Acidimicrobiia bacterium]
MAQAVLLLKEAQWEIDEGFETVKPEVITHYLNRSIRPTYDPLDDAELPDRIERLAAGAEVYASQAGQQKGRAGTY